MWLVKVANDPCHQLIVKCALTLQDIVLNLLKLHSRLGGMLLSEEGLQYLLNVALDCELSVSKFFVNLMS